MSTANTQPTESYDCVQCGTTTPARGMTAGSFCSNECHATHLGQGVLRELERDHKYCYTCFARLKTIEEPGDEWRHRKNSPLEIALDQGATFEPSPMGMVLDATACGYRKATATTSIQGYQYRTENATNGVIDIPLTEPGRYQPGRVYDYMLLSRTCLVCQCGNTHHSSRETIIQDTSIVEVARNLIKSIQALRREGTHDHSIQSTVLVQELKAQVGEEGWDFALAIGKAIHDP